MSVRLLGIVSAFLILGTLGASSPPSARLDPWLRVHPLGTRDVSHREWVHVFLLGDPDKAALRALDVRLHGRAGRVHTARVPRRSLDALSRVPGLDAVMMSRPMELLLDASVDSVHARSLRTLQLDGSWSGHTGQGVILGIVDSGVDVTHEDFRNPDGSTRISAYWDQTDSTGAAPSFGYGSEWTGSQLLSTARAWDTVGHGTHVAGIAAGDGSASAVDSLRYRFVGLAPEAEIVVVAVDISDDTNILDAVHYVFDRAQSEGKAAVVNLSLGNQFGPHDGNMPLETGIDALVGPGRLVVAAAGNDGADRIHATIHVNAGGRDSAEVFVGPYAAGNGFVFFTMDAFYAASASFEVTVVTPNGHRFGPYANVTDTGNLLTGQGTLFLTHVTYPPEPSQVEIGMLVSNIDPDTTDGQAAPPPAGGEWRIVVADRAATGGDVNLWLSLSSIRDVGGNSPFWNTRYVPGNEITQPGTARGVLTAGSWNTKPCWPDSLGQTRCTTVTPDSLTEPGRVTFFSSRGPTTDGRDKPEIVAPGFVVASARSHDISPLYAQLYRFDRTVQPDREHFVYLGTSMAAPHVSGALALALEEDPSLDPARARAALKNTAAHDEHAPRPWGAASGYGKLDVGALVAGFVPVLPGVLRATTNATGRPHLVWAGSDETAFRLESRGDGSAWEERARFSGPGEHAWDESRTADYWSYRLWSTDRVGRTELWAQASWHGKVTVRWSPPSPNPFRERCAISLSALSTRGRIELHVYDAAGRSVRRLYGRTEETTVVWDGRNDAGQTVPAGVYWIDASVGLLRRAARVVKLP